jgi:delta24-sterol reductase
MVHGLVPLVVVEFPNISVGGGFSGTVGERSVGGPSTVGSAMIYTEWLLATVEVRYPC